jgi:adenosylhomocysteine nucleosidase
MIAIITAMDVELENILHRLENAQQVHRPGLFGYTGTLYGQQVIAAVCGVGKVCAAQCTQLLISEYHPEALFHSGIAGAVSPDLRHLDVVVARELTYRDMTEETKRGFLPFGGCFVADPKLTVLLRRAAPESHLGCIATGDLFVHSAAEKERLQRDYNALCAEMESAAVAHVCAVNRVPFGVIRCISDLANDDAHGDYEQFELLASRKSADILSEAVRLYGWKEGEQ